MLLPIADRTATWIRLRQLAHQYRRQLARVVTLQVLASLAGLAGPWLVGVLVDNVTRGTTAVRVDQLIAILGGSVVVGALVSRYAMRAAMVLGEEIFAQVREDFVATVVHLPLSVVERAGTGDLLGRTTNDVDRIQWAVRFGIPRVLVICTTILLTLGAAFVADPAVAIMLLTGVPILVLATRSYLRKAVPAYLESSRTWADLNGVFTEQVEAAGTIDALGIGQLRRETVDAATRDVHYWEKFTLWLRAILFPQMNLAWTVPLLAVLAWGTAQVQSGAATIGAVTTIALYAMQIRGPADELVFWIDEIQVAQASFARLIGVNLVEPDRVPSGERPADDHLVAEGVKYAYRVGHDVLHGIDLDLTPGERLAIVGPSGAGKSTFGRMLAGIHPPGSGRVTVGGVRLVDLAEDELRSQVALVTQEHHVFVGTVAENVRLARPNATDDEVWSALAAVAADGWVRALPDGLATEVGSGARTLTPAQAQQVALARLVLLDPNTLVLDEATSLLDPRSARNLEQSLSAVLAGRTVVAIAHRLHTAHDADRVAVISNGRIAEIGPHEDLVAAGGDYARLWHSWQRE